MSSQDVDRPRARIAEARRNRQKLIVAAAEAFAEGPAPVTFNAIAKAAGVGIGTLYRHFPTREALVEAVYLDQMDRLRSGADEFLATHPPADAFRLWMNLFLEWAATKHGMIDTLRTAISSGTMRPGDMRAGLTAVVANFLTAGVEAGEIRSGIAAEDVSATLAGILAVSGEPGDREQAGRMFDLLMDGLRAR
jgi:AcrR family transcriptional regulator